VQLLIDEEQVLPLSVKVNPVPHFEQVELLAQVTQPSTQVLQLELSFDNQ
jgi:hypothetical protein